MRIELVDGARTEALRRAVLRSDLPDDQPMPPIAPPGAFYLGALSEQDALVGCCVVFPEPYPARPDTSDAWQLRGMATDPTVRGSGVGARLLARAADEVRQHGGRLLWCNARVTALGFYERHGWIAEGEVFLTGQTRLPHRWMARELPADPVSSV